MTPCLSLALFVPSRTRVLSLDSPESYAGIPRPNDSESTDPEPPSEWNFACNMFKVPP